MKPKLQEAYAFLNELDWVLTYGPEGSKAYVPLCWHLLVLGPRTVEEWPGRKHRNWGGPHWSATLRQGLIVVWGGFVLRQGSGVGRPLKGRG